MTIREVLESTLTSTRPLIKQILDTELEVSECGKITNMHGSLMIGVKDGDQIIYLRDEYGERFE